MTLDTAGDFIVTDATRSPVRLPLIVSGTQDVTGDFSLYSVNPADTGVLQRGWHTQLNREPGYSAIQSSDYDVENLPLYRRWRETFNMTDGAGTQSLNLSRTSGTIEPGLYLLDMLKSTDDFDPEGRTRKLVAVSNAVLTVKRSDGELMVFVTDIQTAEPLAGVTVRTYRDGEPAAEAVTNTDGLAYLPAAFMFNLNAAGYYTRVNEYPETYFYDYLFITAERETDNMYGAWYTPGLRPPKRERGYIYTSRPMYRPRETVYFRGVLRDADDMDYTVPDDASVEVHLCYEEYCDDDYEIIKRAIVPVSEFGTFHGAFELPAHLQEDEYSLIVKWRGRAFPTRICEPFHATDYCWTEMRDFIHFTVTDLENPSFNVSLEPEQTDIVVGDSFDMAFNVTNLAGDPVYDVKVQGNLNVTAAATEFSYEDYSFDYYPYRPGRYDDSFVVHGIVENDEVIPPHTDTHGQTVISAIPELT
ncbi:MAG: MG2 domain-containing protein, partial [Aggregatilineales bacterium]